MTATNYNIKDLEQLTGIKAHTLRIWEKRYNIVTPNRTDTNIRYYTDQDVKKLLNISILNRAGIKISILANMSHNELVDNIVAITNKTTHAGSHIENLVVSMIDMNEAKFEKDLNKLIMCQGFEDTFARIIIPFFDKIGVLWQVGAVHPAQEHFMTNLIRQKMIVAIDGVIPTSTPAQPKTYILYLPEKELHEIGLLFASYIIQKAGHKVIYLGQIVPYEDLKRVANTIPFEGLLTVITSGFSLQNVQEHINQLADDFSQKQILITGLQLKMNNLNIPPPVTVFDDMQTLQNLLK
ncbi:MAG: MerR family transcriptional regulator [Bacteroidales bacterium]|nr:MerR family transcriptional regulator [Bacteroidales bacterium]